jgi:Domain of unknown function (DUF4157)
VTSGDHDVPKTSKPDPAYRVWVGGPVPPGADAITLRHVIIVRRRTHEGDGWDHLLRHEIAHVHQWNELGVPRFLRQYLTSYAAARLRGLSHHNAYLQIPLEVEAREFADRTHHTSK